MSQKINFLQNYQLEGEKLPIFTIPAPILKQKASIVTQFDDELRTLIKNMFFTMYNAPGIGLAAPQVGASLRLFVMDIDFNREEITKSDGSTLYELSNFNPQVFINPVFKLSEGEQIYEEGCLSVPGVYEDVSRFEHIIVEYFDMYGEPHSLEADGLLSVCIQHENDHLEGLVFLDRLSTLKRNFLKKKFLKTQKKSKEI